MSDQISVDDFWNEIKSSVILRLEAIAEALEGKIIYASRNYVQDGKKRPIYDTGKFESKITRSVEDNNNVIYMKFWSNVPYAQYVLGGSLPHWAPAKAIEQWIERKRFVWVDKNNKKMTIKQMSWLVRRKIARYGVTERNVLRDVLESEMTWLENELKKIGKEAGK